MTVDLEKCLLWIVGAVGSMFFVLHALGLFVSIDLLYSTSPEIDTFAFHNDFRRCGISFDVLIMPQRAVDHGWRLELISEGNPLQELWSSSIDVLMGRSKYWISLGGGFRSATYSLFVAHPVLYSPCALILLLTIRRRRKRAALSDMGVAGMPQG